MQSDRTPQRARGVCKPGQFWQSEKAKNAEIRATFAYSPLPALLKRSKPQGKLAGNAVLPPSDTWKIFGLGITGASGFGSEQGCLKNHF